MAAMFRLIQDRRNSQNLHFVPALFIHEEEILVELWSKKQGKLEIWNVHASPSFRRRAIPVNGDRYDKSSRRVVKNWIPTSRLPQP